MTQRESLLSCIRNSNDSDSNVLLIWHTTSFRGHMNCYFLYHLLIPPTPSILESCIKIKVKLNSYLNSLWCIKCFIHKTFWGTTKKCENKNFSYFFFLFVWDREMKSKAIFAKHQNVQQLQRRIQNPVKHLRCKFCWGWRLKD